MNSMTNSSLEGGEITWKLLHEVFDKDENLLPNLIKAYKSTYKVISNKKCRDNKQKVSLALTILQPTRKN